MHLYCLPLFAALMALTASALDWNVGGYSVGFITLVAAWLLFVTYLRSNRRQWWITIVITISLTSAPFVGVIRHVATSPDWQQTIALIGGIFVVFSAMVGLWMETFSSDNETRRTGRWLAVIAGLIIPFLAYGSATMSPFNLGIVMVAAIVTAVVIERRKRIVAERQPPSKGAQHV